LTYDFNGNMTTAQDSLGTANYIWDSRNRLAAIAAPGFTAGFAYDALGRRTTKTVTGVTTNYVYDGLNPVQEKAGASVTANILPGLGIDEYFTRTDSTGTQTFTTDALGSSVALTDNTGTVQTQYTYEPFGNTTVAGTTSTNSLQYTGRESDGTGLYYLRARYYSPRLQRFVSEDPIGFEGGDANLYAYVRNNPANLVDPSGLFFVPGAVIGGVIGGVSAVAGGLAQNATGAELVASLAWGVMSGAIVGGLPGVGSSLLAGGLLGATSDLASQYLTNITKGRKDIDINWSSVIGAGIGGVTGTRFGNIAKSLGTGYELGPVGVKALSSGAAFVGSVAPSYFGTEIGLVTGF
jgi:RHS repeat-associated protein